MNVVYTDSSGGLTVHATRSTRDEREVWCCRRLETAVVTSAAAAVDDKGDAVR